MTSLPAEVARGVVNAYADALVPMFLWLVPMFLVGTVIAFFLPEVPLATTTALGEGEADAAAEEAGTVPPQAPGPAGSAVPAP